MPVVTVLPGNADVAAQFDLLADLLELEGAESFRVLAYRRAATRMRETSGSIAPTGCVTTPPLWPYRFDATTWNCVG